MKKTTDKNLTEDEVLRRLLATPPTPFTPQPKATKKKTSAKKAAGKH